METILPNRISLYTHRMRPHYTQRVTKIAWAPVTTHQKCDSVTLTHGSRTDEIVNLFQDGCEKRFHNSLALFATGESRIAPRSCG
jgi:hypothetical protein